MKYLTWLLLSLLSTYSYSQNKIVVHPTNSKIKIDGIIDEPIWKEIRPLYYIQHTPNYGKQPTELTQVRMTYDDEFLYVSGMLYDSEEPRANSFQRDGGNASSDWFGIAIDTYNDKENALAFFTTPNGLRWDATVVDGQGGVSLNTNWNSYWDVGTTKPDSGWVAEFKIPFSSLRFQSVGGETTMNIITWRLLARNNEWNIYPNISPEHGGLSFYKISHGQEIVFKEIKSKNPVYITPYLLGGNSQSYKHNQNETGLIAKDEYKTEIGLDVKYSITSNITLDATINTDFAQVEADDQEINLSRFSLFFPEKRQFFQERSSSFEMNFSGNNKVLVLYEI